MPHDPPLPFPRRPPPWDEKTDPDLDARLLDDTQRTPRIPRKDVDTWRRLARIERGVQRLNAIVLGVGGLWFVDRVLHFVLFLMGRTHLQP